MTVSSDDNTPLRALRDLVQEFVNERDWQRFHNAKNLSMALSIEAAELMEHFQWLTTEQVVAEEGFSKAAVAEELADVTCYVIALANALGIDLSSAVQEKMVKNKLKYPVAGDAAN